MPYTGGGWLSPASRPPPGRRARSIERHRRRAVRETLATPRVAALPCRDGNRARTPSSSTTRSASCRRRSRRRHLDLEFHHLGSAPVNDAPPAGRRARRGDLSWKFRYPHRGGGRRPERRSPPPRPAGRSRAYRAGRDAPGVSGAEKASATIAIPAVLDGEDQRRRGSKMSSQGAARPEHPRRRRCHR